jgi:hypothetical protein
MRDDKSWGIAISRKEDCKHKGVRTGKDAKGMKDDDSWGIAISRKEERVPKPNASRLAKRTSTRGRAS